MRVYWAYFAEDSDRELSEDVTNALVRTEDW